MSAEAPQPPTFRIVIDFNGETGNILVTGPTENLTLFLGMMETAKFVVLQERIAQKNKSTPMILPPPADFSLRQH